MTGALDLAAKALLPCFKDDISNLGLLPLFLRLAAFLVNPPPPPLPPPPPKEFVVPISITKFVDPSMAVNANLSFDVKFKAKIGTQQSNDIKIYKVIIN